MILRRSNRYGETPFLLETVLEPQKKNKVDYCDNFFSVAGDFGLVKF